MPRYFAFGSNMSRLRLERRVGEVVDRGRAVLADYRHGFAKRVSDGSGAGNIEPRAGREVHGVLYELTDAQLEVLAGYEGGYDRVVVEVRQGDEVVSAATFRAPAWAEGLLPRDDYLDHYRRGMREHDLPDAYVREVLELAGAPVS